MKCVLVVVFLVSAVLALPKAKLNESNDISSRIFGGSEAAANSHPYIGYLTFFKYKDGTSWKCGGTLISNNYVLTSARCATGANLVEVILGVHDIYKAEPSQLIMQCTDITIHENYDSTTYENDIAIVKAAETITFTNAIKAATLPKQSDAVNTYIGTKTVVSGWGLTETGKISEVLLDAEAEIVSLNDCTASNPKDTNICTGANTGKAICSGDYGSPLVVSGTDNLIGIASYSSETCQAGNPSLYTKVASYLAWIQQHSDVTV